MRYVMRTDRPKPSVVPPSKNGQGVKNRVVQGVRDHWKKGAVSLGVLLLLGGVGYAWYMLRPDPKLERALQLQAQLFSPESRELPRDQRRDLEREMWRTTRDLDEQQREKLFENMQRGFERRLDEFFALSPEDRVKMLDKEIDRMEEMQKRWQERRRRSAEEREKSGQSGEQSADRGDRGRGGRGFSRSSDPKQRQDRFRRLLDRTTPERRAKMGEFFLAMQQRRQARGLPPRGPWGP